MALLSFGAVQAHAFLFVTILWLIAIATLVIWEAIRSKTLGHDMIAYVVLSAIALMIDHKMALGVMAAGWGMLATRNSTLKTLSFLKFLIAVGALEALLGLTQYFVAPGWIFGYHNDFYNSTGTLINRNHFAGFLEMVIPATVAFGFAAMRRGELARSYFYFGIGAFITVAIVFSTSRMGLVSAFFTIMFLAATLRLKNGYRRTGAIALLLIPVVVSGALWIGVGTVIQRFEEISGDELLQGRPVLYADTLRMIVDHPSGIGLGAYRDIFRQYQTYRLDRLFDHAHNDYLEIAAEWGILPAAVFWILIFIILGRAVRSFLRTRSTERDTVLIASLGALCSILLHSLTDFNLQIPSNAMLFFLFVGIAAQAGATRPDEPSR